MTPSTPTEFEIDGHEYRIGKLSAFQQFHVSRKIAPILPPLIPVVMKVRAAVQSGAPKSDGSDPSDIAALPDGAEAKVPAADTPTLDIASLPEILQPLADALSAMPDEAAEYVIGTCLSALKRKIPDKDHWAPVWNPSGKVLMFADLYDLSAYMKLVVRVVMDSLGPFIAGFLTGPGTGPKTKTE
jgi:hypothetical protein